MKVFEVCIEESCVQTFDIEAETAEAALEIVKEGWKTGEYYVDSGEVHGCTAEVFDETLAEEGTAGDWRTITIK